MKKILSFILLGFAVVAFAIDPISRFEGPVAVDPNSTGVGKTLVKSGSSTNEYQSEVVTATVTGAQTSSTNTFGTTYLATPSVFRGYVSGLNGTQTTNSLYTTVTVTTTTLIVNGLSTNASTGVNNLPLHVYGYTRTGKYQ